MARPDLSDAVLQDLYTWVDQIPLSRPKRSISRDFSDGVLVAELVQHFYPKLVDMHNYSVTNAIARKTYNWATLNKRLFRRMGFAVPPQDIDDVVNARKGAVEHVLLFIRQKMGEYETKKQKKQLQSMATGHLAQAEDVTYAAPGAMTAPNRQASPPATYGRASQRCDKCANTEAMQRDRDEQLRKARQTSDILQLKVDKLEQLLRLKDSKIASMSAQLQALNPPSDAFDSDDSLK
ncbi:unnamed protein product (mitochondrion) [Plasmodiophora brassicae]|uniref:Calponin-homology (CH) domain-containing protein n=1 Tax=Plasmodiophora brassicae TaxID=37360 RepID=A0A3P3YMC4_PLABS|nr:unnamed protein product [Plasmodiophora brassicae]